MRYFLELAYKGTHFHGYQSQPNADTIQSEIETCLRTILGVETQVVGCGRTDTGVHASQFFLHFDTDTILEGDLFIYKLNAIVHPDIVFYRLHPVADDAHARFDAESRSYAYYMDLKRDPFRQETAYFFPFQSELDIELMNQVVTKLKSYTDFTTFCKSRTDVKNKICTLTRSEWHFDEERSTLIYKVSANRFLRGMIRLIVGMSIQVGRGTMSVEHVVSCMENRSLLDKPYSAPAKGLFLRDIIYPYISNR